MDIKLVMINKWKTNLTDIYSLVRGFDKTEYNRNGKTNGPRMNIPPRIIMIQLGWKRSSVSFSLSLFVGPLKIITNIRTVVQSIQTQHTTSWRNEKAQNVNKKIYIRIGIICNKKRRKQVLKIKTRDPKTQHILRETEREDIQRETERRQRSERDLFRRRWGGSVLGFQDK